MFFNYGVDTGTVWKSAPFHATDPCGGTVWWDRHSPVPRGQRAVAVGLDLLPPGKDGQGVLPADEPRRPCTSQGHPAEGTAARRPCHPRRRGTSQRPLPDPLCELAGIKPRKNIETGKEEPWELKDHRKTCATYHDEHILEVVGRGSSAIRSAASPTGTTHYARPLAFKGDSMSLPPTGRQKE